MTELGDFEQAMASYHAALALAPDDVQLHRELGHVLQMLGRVDEAAASERQADLFTQMQAVL